MSAAIAGSRVRLRDVELADADLLDEWARNPRDRGGYNDFGQEPPVLPREVLANGPLRNEKNGMFVVELVAGAQPIGTVGWRLVTNYGPSPGSDAWNIGIELRPEARGSGYGAEAQRLLADWLFANSGVNRVEATTDVENLAEQRALEKAGFLREGTHRGAQFRAGAYHDLVVYARLRADG